MPGTHLTAASMKLDLVIVAARYADNPRRLALVQAYERRGAVWGDIVLLDRPALLARLKARRRVVAGRPKELPGDFELVAPLHLIGKDDRAQVLTEGQTSTGDELGVPLF